MLRIENVQNPGPDVINRPDEAARDDPNHEVPEPEGHRLALTAELAGPIELELAKAVEQLPG
jgi:hypothetical protein